MISSAWANLTAVQEILEVHHQINKAKEIKSFW